MLPAKFLARVHLNNCRNAESNKKADTGADGSSHKVDYATVEIIRYRDSSAHIPICARAPM
jgi:hypothetical protein